jgi:hypothetical protein
LQDAGWVLFHAVTDSISVCVSLPPYCWLLQADRSVRNLYKLHSVLVHSGGVHGGHYYAYIRPDGRSWLKFDDTSVTMEDEHKALEEQYGGEDQAVPAAGEQGSTVWESSHVPGEVTACGSVHVI